MFASAEETVKFIKDKKIEVVDLKITTLVGNWIHVTIPARTFTHHHFEEGVGFDGSSGSGFTKIESGDVVAIPDPSTAFVDPFLSRPTLSFLCDTVTADTRVPFANGPRTIAKKAESYLASTGLADKAVFGPEFEFNIFDRVEVFNEPFATGVEIEADEVHTDGVRCRIPAQRGYMHIPPGDQLCVVRDDIAAELEQIGIPVRYHHHEVGAAGQCEIEVHLDTLVRAADYTQIIKYVVKNVAARHGKIATFMPKPIFGEAGNGMHVHQKLDHNGEYVFYDQNEKNYANLSDLALSYIAGLLKHGAALTALTNPSTNSFKRLVEGYEAPVCFVLLGGESLGRHSRATLCHQPARKADRVSPTRLHRQHLPVPGGYVDGRPGRHREQARSCQTQFRAVRCGHRPSKRAVSQQDRHAAAIAARSNGRPGSRRTIPVQRRGVHHLLPGRLATAQGPRRSQTNQPPPTPL